MPTVPYTGVPTVTPSDSAPLPYQSSAAATPDAFGAQVGQAQERAGRAEEGLGRAIDQFGDVLSRHALKMQDDLNKAWANDAFVSGVEKAGELKAKLQTMEGNRALEFYKNEYVPGIKKIGDDLSAAAPNSEAKKFFQQDFRRRLGFDIENGAGYAAGQTKRAASASADAVVTSSRQDTAAAARSEPQFKLNRDITRKAIQDKSQLHGWSKEQEDEELKKADSSLFATRIESIAMTDPFEARRIYDKNKDQIDGEMQVKIEKHLMQQDSVIGTRLDADAIVQGRTAPKMPAPLGGGKGITAIEPLTPDSPPEWLGTAINQAQAVARARAPDNPKYEDDLVARVRTEYNNVKTIKNEADRANYNTVLSRALGIGGNGAGPVKSMDEIYGDAALNQAYFALPPARQNAILKQVETNAKRDVPLTPDRMNLFTQLKGMAVSDKEGFANLDLASADLPARQKGELLLQQTKIKQTGQQELGLNKVLSYVRPLLNAAQVGSSTTDKVKADQYNLFLGAFQDQVQAFENEKKRLPSEKEAKEMASRLLVDQNSEGRWFAGVRGYLQGRVFEATVPADDARKIEERIKDRGGTPTDELVRRVWILQKYGTSPK